MDDRLGSARAAPAKEQAEPKTPLGSAPEDRTLEPEDSVLDLDGSADSAERLVADRELRDVLAAEGFTGHAYAVLEDELASYGHQIMTAWLASGHIFARCASAGLHLLSLPISLNDREDLAQESVTGALRSFRQKGLAEGGWQPEGGASLKSYFTGSLLQNFANVWKKRLRASQAVSMLPLDSLPAEPQSPAPGPADIATQRDEISRGLAGIEGARTRIAVALTAEGYEQEEIAEILGPGVTPRAVEGLMRRHRSRLAARDENGGGPR